MTEGGEGRPSRKRQRRPQLDILETEEEEQKREEREEELARAESPTSVKPIHDVPDTYVFRFQVGPAILSQLRAKLVEIPPVALTSAIDAKYPGFYQLFVGDDAKYIGKTSKPLGARLKRHVRKLTGRIGINVSTIRCKYAFVEDRSLIDVAEGALISYFGELDAAEWNQSGFGSNVTGHGRGRQRRSKWSEQFPPDLEHPITVVPERTRDVIQLITRIAQSSPLTLSIPKKHRAAFELAHNRPVVVQSATMPFRDWIEYIKQMLADGWEVERGAETWYIVQK